MLWGCSWRVTYEGTYWHQADEEQFRETFSGEQDAWVIQNLLYLYVGNTGTREAQDVTVEKARGGGDYGYVPYGFQTPDDENLRGRCAPLGRPGASV